MSVFSNEAFDGHERVVFAEDKAAGLQAIIAIHNRKAAVKLWREMIQGPRCFSS